MEIKITEEKSGERLDKFLVGLIAENNLSRAQIQSLIKSGDILVNGQTVSPHYNLKKDDLVTINKLRPAKILKKPVLKNGRKFKLDVLKETPDYLVINKPAGIIVHGADHINEVTLVDELIKKYPEIAQVGDDPSRPGIVHRLDKEVSGLMVIAKNQDFFDALKNQFKKRTVVKNYTALVYGKISMENGILNFPIKRSSSGYKMAALPATGKNSESGKKAITEYHILNRFINYTLLKVKIKTGRTHQIRVHLSAFGHPVVGDDLYGTPKTRINNKKLKLGRIFLMADELVFSDRQGEKQSFNIHLPDDLKNLLKNIK